MRSGVASRENESRLLKDDDYPGTFAPHGFDFLGYSFRPRLAKRKDGKLFVGFLPAMSPKAAKSVRDTIRSWNLAKGWNTHSLEAVAKFINPTIRGWANYYGRFNRWEYLRVLSHLNLVLAIWAKRRYKRFKGSWQKVFEWLVRLVKRDESLFVLWALVARPTVGRKEPYEARASRTDL